MVNYRRLKIPGAIYFFTVNLHNRKETFLTDYITSLTAAFKKTREKFPFKTIAMVVMPDHLHAIWQLPDDDYNFSLRWRKIKYYFTRALIKKGVNLKMNRRREYDLWQKRYWEHVIRDDKDFENHVNYVHYNPVKHKLVNQVKYWPYSTLHRYIRLGILPENWGDLGKYDMEGVEMGES